MPKSKIIKELVNDEISLEKALHRVIVLAKDLKDFKLEQWAKNEINGYRNPEEIPEYRRRVKLVLMGIYCVGGLKFENAPLPTEFLKKLSKEDREKIVTCKLCESVDYLKSTKEKGEKLGIPIPLEQMHHIAYGTNVEILSARKDIVESEISRIINEVKTKILDILCELEDKFGCLDDMDIADSDDKIKNEARQNIYNIIMCDTYNGVEIGDNNTIKKSNFLSKIKNKKWI